MFTGIVDTIGTLERSDVYGDARRLLFESDSLDLCDVKIGDSIAVSGPCLTVVSLTDSGFEVDVSEETLRCSTLGQLRKGDCVNLEKALRVSDRLGGHLVSGHVDGIGQVTRRESRGDYVRFKIETPEELSRYIAPKGSICVDGVSLTINDVGEHWFDVFIIPHTLDATTLGSRKQGGLVNIEVDLLARYIERLLDTSASLRDGADITLDKLMDSGFVPR